MNISQFATVNKNLLKEYRIPFFKLFGFELRSYMDLITGFDIIKFDERIGTPDGVSTKDFLQSKYGNNAVKIIQSLIGVIE